MLQYFFFASGACYEGRPINKLQNGIILFQNMKNPKYRFVRNFILNNSCEFYYDDVTAIFIVNR